MKNGFQYKDGKVLVLDDKLGQVEYDYHDDIDEELITENIIEQIQNSLASAKYALGCQETIKTSKYSRNKRYVRYLLNVLIPTIGIGLFTVLYAGGLHPIILLSSLGFELGTIFNIDYNREYNVVQNRINALLVKIDELKNKLVIENQKLIELRKKKEVSLNQQVDDKDFKRINEDEFQNLSNLEALWYQTGYHLNDYYGYEQNGTLRELLHDVYTHNGELDEVERVTKIYGPVLARKLTTPKNTGNKQD